MYGPLKRKAIMLVFAIYTHHTAMAAMEPERPFEMPGEAPGPYTGGGDGYNPILPFIVLAWVVFGPLTLCWTLLVMIVDKLSSGEIDSGFDPRDGYNPGRALASAALTFVPFILVAIFRSS
jgi:hypothetical protein